MLDALPATCPFECGAAVTRGNLEAHTKMCEQHLFDCLAKCGCSAFKSKAQLLDHMVTHHADEVDSALQQFYAAKWQKDRVEDVGAAIVQPVSSQALRLATLSNEATASEKLEDGTPVIGYGEYREH